MNEPSLWPFILDRLSKDRPVALLVVAAAEGETPGKPGFKMAVGAGGALCGSIGGGAIEHDMVEAARDRLRRRETAPSVHRFEHRPGGPDRSGMVCGGTQTVLLYVCRAADRPAVERLCRAPGARLAGGLRLTQRGLSFLPEPAAPEPVFRQHRAGEWSYEEAIGPAGTVYIAGGGHVCLALSRILATLDLAIVVFDDRPDLETLRLNRFAGEKRIIPFDEVGRHVPEGDTSYALIMTPSHRADEAVLRQLLPKRLGYLGLMGSASKVRHIFGRLRADGFPDEALARVHAPVGLPIHSHTPAEIAVSIAAEIIQVRNCATSAPSAHG
jgi:xanthine dehydrogenase accessory factor